MSTYNPMVLVWWSGYATVDDLNTTANNWVEDAAFRGSDYDATNKTDSEVLNDRVLLERESGWAVIPDGVLDSVKSAKSFVDAIYESNFNREIERAVVHEMSLRFKVWLPSDQLNFECLEEELSPTVIGSYWSDVESYYQPQLGAYLDATSDDYRMLPCDNCLRNLLNTFVEYDASRQVFVVKSKWDDDCSDDEFWDVIDKAFVECTHKSDPSVVAD